MSKDPAILFYTSDFLTGTYVLTYEQRGKYITLLCLQHQSPENEVPENVFDRTVQGDLEIRSKFVKTDTGYYNQRLREESIRRKSYCESRKKSIEKRYVSKTHESTYVDHTYIRMENENVNENVNEKKEKRVQGEKQINIPFETFWNLYDKKRDKDKCIERWKSLTDDERKKAIEFIPAYKSATEKQFRKDPIRFLKNKSWNDEIIHQNSTQNKNLYQNITPPNKTKFEASKRLEAEAEKMDSRTPEEKERDKLIGNVVKFKLINRQYREYSDDQIIEMYNRKEIEL